MSDQTPIYIPVPAAVYSEFVLRRGEHYDVAARMADILQDYLDRTYGDAAIWSAEHADEAAESDVTPEEQRRINGDPTKGYQWQTVFIPNGTEVRMLYRGQNHYAAVQHEKFVYNGESESPSQFARKVADNSSRNAWRDLYLRFPGSREWEQADVIRKQRVVRRP